MKKLLIGLLAMSTLSVQASVYGPLEDVLEESKVMEDKTHFETLGDMFSAGTKPNPNKISNTLWSGRCFRLDNQNKAINGAYVIRQLKNEAGPIGEGKIEWESLTVFNKRGSPSYYDEMTLSKLYLDTKHLPFESVTIKANSVDNISDDESVKYSLKMSGNYLIGEITAKDYSIKSQIKEVALARCYYFIPQLNLQ